MARLPVIVGFGGGNAAGRSSFHQAYQRTILESLPMDKYQETLLGLATMMGRVTFTHNGYKSSSGDLLSAEEVVKHFSKDIISNTLVRRIQKTFWDVDHTPSHQSVSISKLQDKVMTFTLSRKKLPSPLPEGWQVSSLEDNRVSVTVSAVRDHEPSFKLSTSYISPVQAAGQLPDGFDPAAQYPSRFHPRGLQLSIIGASDATNSMGINWSDIMACVAPDEVAVYSSSVMGQLDDYGFGGLLKARLNSERVSTKQVALGMGSMSADFINAYVLGSMGATGSIAGACATFLYNLRAGIEDIRSGCRRVVVVGSSEAPIIPEIIDGYSAMGALATDEKLCKLDGVTTPNYHRASRPFGENCGFTIAESTQQVVLMDDALAVELGANIYGAVTDVFINADGYKKSISAPGPGNYLTFARAVASARSLLGVQAVRYRSFVQAHGSSTPKNRVSESEILDRIAGVFGINNWPVAAVKSYVGHSLAPASGDQLINSLGVFSHGVLPGIKTIDRVAEDVCQKRLNLSTRDVEFEQIPEVAFLNSKGFGGNNATACILSPQKTQDMLACRYGNKIMKRYSKKNQSVVEKAENYNQSALRGDMSVKYHFGQSMVDEKEIKLSKTELRVPGFGSAIDLTHENIYKDML
ncbi:beta-ketoacyl synthase [Candidatus Endobugula sertula]|uniref:Beta-ketoacyl synthase n=1 Tax=Candidatus Endobugula sertula TaxID=62101 RepID=A0A1D2QS61_9GAMM|nr:beta-ketoacyl synthase [Candidatus Endobugula sertula]